MKPLPAYFYLIVVLIGGFVTRECVKGSLQKPEGAYTTWLEETTAPNPIPQITLITADTGGQLTSLDVALFLRAVIQFKARVAAIVTYDLAPGDEDLLASVLGRDSRTSVVSGALLTDSAGGSANFQPVKWTDPAALPRFVGVRNNLPAVPATTFGFLNLPGNENAQSVPVLSQLGEQTVPSFAFACLTSYLEHGDITLHPRAVGNDLVFSNQSRLTVESNGNVKLVREAYSQVARYSLGDLLVAAEKTEQATEANPAVVESIRGRIVILAPAPSGEEISDGTFTMGQFQALGIASIASQTHRLSLGIWIWWIPFVWFFPWLKISERWIFSDQLPAIGLVGTFYALFSFTVAQEFGLFLPGIPALVWFAALLGVIFVRRKAELE